MLKLSYHTKLSRKGTIFLMNKSITQDMTYRQSLFEKVKLTNGGCSCYNNINAGVAELADAPDLGSGISDVQVQVLSPAPDNDNPNSIPIGDGFGFLVYLEC